MRCCRAAIDMHVEDVENNRRLSHYGAELIDDGDTILTHCNAGALATGGYGTALGVIRAAWEAGKSIQVIATETRPYFQGARLTVWELREQGIDVTLVPDNHAGLLCQQGIVDRVIVGADRVARNGDVANKIGTYMIALAAHDNEVPFYVAAPLSSFDESIRSGEEISIEERDGREVKYVNGRLITSCGRDGQVLWLRYHPRAPDHLHHHRKGDPRKTLRQVYKNALLSRQA